MKKINFFLFVLLQVFAFQAMGQSVLNDGRDASMAPSAAVEQETTQSVDRLNNGSDFDVPGQQAEDRVVQDDWSFPVDLEVLREELGAGAGAAEMTAKINDLAKQLEALVQANEQLREENRLIRKSLNSCCSSGNLGLNASDAYLVQNAPNPFTEFSEVKYFVPEGITGAQLEIRDVKGDLVKAYDLSIDGYGKVNIGDQLIQSGTYIYSLNIGGEVIDSKVMVLTK